MNSVSRRVSIRANEIARDFEFSDYDARQAVQLFLAQMEEGLQRDGTSLSQLPTYVTVLPTGREEGLYLAVDLGGTNLRVCSVQLIGDQGLIMTPPQASDIPIPEHHMESQTTAELFGWVAQEISKFLQTFHQNDLEKHRSENPYRLGFSFSHAYEQQGIKKGILIRWSKAFDIPDAIGKDICALLQAELDKLGLPVVVTALVNDTTGTLLARAYEIGGKPKTILGAIFGTGTNGAYFEKLENIQKLDYSYMSGASSGVSSREMIINTEWGAFDNQLLLLPTTKFDRAVDESSVNPHQEMFEKRISGLYLGEILRHVILHIYSMEGQWRTHLPRPSELKASPLNIPWGIDSSFLSALADESRTERKYTDMVIESRLKTNLDQGVSFLASTEIRMISLAIAKRAARLAGVAIAAVIIRSRLLADLNNVTQNRVVSSIAPGFEIQSPPSTTTITAITMSIYRLCFRSIVVKWQLLFWPNKRAASSVEDVAPLIDIGVTGSLWQKYPRFEIMVRELLREIPEIGPEGEKRIRIGIAGNGSLVGAALGAALAETGE